MQLKWMPPEEPGGTGVLTYSLFCNPAPSELDAGMDTDPEVRPDIHRSAYCNSESFFGVE